MFISPMLLHKIDEPFDHDDYVSELKMDGFRLIYSYIEDKKLFTRNKTDVTNRFPELFNLNIPKGTVLDGEVVITDSFGKPDFEAVMSRFSVFTRTESNSSQSMIQCLSWFSTYCTMRARK
jgi:DNA ligase 1